MSKSSFRIHSLIGHLILSRLSFLSHCHTPQGPLSTKGFLQLLPNGTLYAWVPHHPVCHVWKMKSTLFSHELTAGSSASASSPCMPLHPANHGVLVPQNTPIFLSWGPERWPRRGKVLAAKPDDLTSECQDPHG